MMRVEQDQLSRHDVGQRNSDAHLAAVQPVKINQGIDLISQGGQIVEAPERSEWVRLISVIVLFRPKPGQRNYSTTPSAPLRVAGRAALPIWTRRSGCTWPKQTQAQCA